jgi:protein CASC3
VKQAPEPATIKLEEPIAKNSTTLRNMCWADVSEAADSMDALVDDNVLEESAVLIGKVTENELEKDGEGKNCSSSEAEHQTLSTPARDDEQDDDDDENYGDIESDASERLSSRAEPVDSDDELQQEEESVTDPDAKAANKHPDDEQDEESDATSSDQAAKPLDDDEDMRKPQYIPKRGAFYEHDDRLGSDEESKAVADRESVKSDTSSQPVKSVKPLTISNKKSTPVRVTKDQVESKVLNMDSDRWGHDMFREEEQKPKSREELMTSYGYDIRNQDAGPQKAVRYNKKSISHSRSNRSGKEDSDRSPHTRRGSDDQHVIKVNNNNNNNNNNNSNNSISAPSSAASRANEKIAMREAHQENERRRYERETKPAQSQQRGGDRTTSHRQDNRRVFERSDRRQNDDMPPAGSRNPAPRRPFNRDDFPELTSHRPSDHSQRKPRDEAGAWNRNNSTGVTSSRRRDHSSDESQERPVVRTQVVYSSSRFTKDSRSPNSDTHSNFNNNPPTNGSHRGKYDRSHDRNDRNDHRDSRHPGGQRRSNAGPSARPNDSGMNRYNQDHDVRSQRNNRRDYHNDRAPNRQNSRKENDDVPQRISDPVNDLTSGIQKMGLDQRNQHRRPPVSNSQVIEVENRPKRYSATRTQQPQPQTAPQQPLLAPTNVPAPEVVSHHPAIAHQPMTQQVNSAPHPYYDPGPQSPPEYYADADGPAYAAYPADPSTFMAHHPRYLPSHPVAPAPNPLTPASTPLSAIPGTTATFLPTFTPSLPPSGFPQYPPPQQYHHTIGPPVPGATVPQPPGSEMFRGGVTYYDTTQQQPMRSLPPKRPKNILPILPPPEIADGHHPDMLTHQDSSNTGY